MKAHLEHSDTAGGPIGRDPRQLSALDLETLGRPRISRGGCPAGQMPGLLLW
jgi:hypothetical protein